MASRIYVNVFLIYEQRKIVSVVCFEEGAIYEEMKKNGDAVSLVSCGSKKVTKERIQCAAFSCKKI